MSAQDSVISIEQMSFQCIPKDMEKSQEYWPAEEEFQEFEILKWRDLPKGVYKIHEYEVIKRKFGDSCILTIKTKDNREPIALFTDNFTHLHYNAMQRRHEAISSYFVIFARNCLAFVFSFIVMQM